MNTVCTEKMARDELKIARMEKAKKLKALDDTQKTGFVMYIAMSKLDVVKMTSKAGKQYEAVRVHYTTLRDGEFRQYEKTPAFIPQGKYLLEALKPKGFFRVVVDKRNGEDYPQWYDIEECGPKVAKVLTKCLKEKDTVNDEAPF